MSRDHRKLQVFQMADTLALCLYRGTTGFPQEERFGLQSQLRRGGVSIVANIVEGAARRTTREYLHFLNVSLGSAAEVDYLLDLTGRLGYLDTVTLNSLREQTGHLIPALKGLITALDAAESSQSPRPKAQSPG
ncbi:MAG: four helix bundle protein [Holophagaceae bacterium]